MRKSNKGTKSTKGKKKGTKVEKSAAATLPKPVSTKDGRVQVDIAKFLQTFDGLIHKKEVLKAQQMLDSLRGIKKWQRLNLQALVEMARDDSPKAEALLRESLREDEVGYAVNRNLAILLVRQGRMREGLPYAEKAYKQNKTDLKTLHIYINCLLDLGKSEESLAICEEAVKTFPEDKLVLVSKASSLRSLMRMDEALMEIDLLINKFPKEPVVRRIKADLLGDTSTKEALPYYEEAYDLSIEEKGKPDPAIMWNMSLHLLRARKLEKGWSCWEQGFHPVVGTMGRNLPKRINDLERADQSDKEINREHWTIIVSEQGIGDQVLFMHSLNECIEELGKVLFIAEKRMHPILQRSFPKLIVANPGMTYDWSRSGMVKNGYIPLGSIPRRHRQTVNDYEKNRKPFLIANKNLYGKYREVLTKRAAGRPIIGISWRGGYWKIQRKTKALEIEKWEKIFAKDALFVNLQYGDISKEVNYLADKKLNMVTFTDIDYRVHLDAWVAIAAACDGIVSISTALVHFAGAIGQKVAVVMPGVQGPWHLGLEDKRSMAYKNVRIYRPESRDEPIDKVVQRVADLIIE